ncbi:MAG: hypothetical protein AAFP69_07740, partial [Planctomycetota bacterium]
PTFAPVLPLVCSGAGFAMNMGPDPMDIAPGIYLSSRTTVVIDEPYSASRDPFCSHELAATKR